MVRTFYVPFYLVMSSFLFLLAHAQSECTEADIQYSFTPCDPDTNQKTSVAYYGRACKTTPSVNLPPPKAAPCTVKCSSGTFYSPKTLGCEACAAGTFSFSTGDQYLRFDSWPKEFATFCKPEPCSPWTISPAGTYLYSGVQPKSNATDDQSVIVSLVTTATIVNLDGGKLSFWYRVESEDLFDGLGLLLNGSRYQISEYAYFISSGVHRQFRLLEVLLPYGSTQITWTYEKDSDDSSPLGVQGVGLDRAFLRKIKIDGTKFSTEKCTLCPKGHFSVAGQDTCSMCPSNTYSFGGSASCTACSPNQWSPSGSSECIAKRACDKEHDYLPQYTACDGNGRRDRSWVPANPNCLDTNTPPVDKDLPCESCMPGLMKDAQGNCVTCQRGYSYENGKCNRCEAGTAAVKHLTYPHGFDLLNNKLENGGFSTVCHGVCRGCTDRCDSQNGWMVGSVSDNGNPKTVLHSGFGHGYDVESILQRTVTLYTQGRISFEYYFQRRYDTDLATVEDVEGTFSMDLVKIPLDPNSYDNVIRKGRFVSHLLNPATYVLQWSFRKNWVHDEDNPISLVVTSLDVEGEETGGVPSCASCRPGYYCPNGGQTQMNPCPTGFASSQPGQSVCTRCVGQMVTTEYAQPYCIECPPGTHAADNNDRCVNDCLYSEGGMQYDLRSLRAKRFGPIFVDRTAVNLNRDVADLQNVHRFYFDICEPVNEDENDDTCRLQYGQRVELAYVCQRLNGNRSYSLGDWVTYRGLGHTGLELSFSSGDKCNNGHERTTNITLLCVGQLSDLVNTVRFVGENPTCHYTFEFYTPSACPVCTADAIDYSYGPCDSNGTQLVTPFIKPESRGCVGGVPLGPAKRVTCNRCLPEMYDFTWSQCVNGIRTTMYFVKANYTGCTDDGTNTPATRSESCMTINARPGANAFTIITLSVVSVIVVLSLCVFRIMKERNKLRVQYQLLSREAHSTNELQQVSSHHEEDGDEGEDEMQADS